MFCYLINGSIFEILNQLFKGSLTIIILYLLSIIVLLLAFFFRTFDEIFDLYYKLLNNIFKIMVLFTFIFVFVYLIFEPSSETFNFILLYFYFIFLYYKILKNIILNKNIFFILAFI